MMAEPLEIAKAARNEAHRAFHERLMQVRADLEARGVGGRIVDRTGEAIADAAEVANEHKGAVVGTVAALVAWFLRGPITRLVARLGDDDESEDEERTPEDD